MGKLISKILDYISSKFDTSEERRAEIEHYDKKRLRLIQMAAKTPKLSKFKIFWINQFMTLFGCGRIKIAPGTIASFVTVEVWFIITLSFVKNNISPLMEGIIWTSVILISSLYAVIFIPIFTKDMDDYDHSSIVVDEVIGQLITLCISYTVVREYYHQESWILPKMIMLAHMFLSFLLFRTLDIAKPSIIGYIDRNIKNPFGVILDDVVAGLVGAFLMVTLFLFYENSIINLHNL